MALTPNALHVEAVEAVVTRLRRRGFIVTRTKRSSLHRNAGDLIVNGLAVAVLVSRGHVKHIDRAYRTIPKGKKVTYHYDVPMCQFNFHTHGRRRTAVDVYVLVYAQPGAMTFFLIPTEMHPGKTLSLRTASLPRHWLWEWKDAWGTIRMVQENKERAA